jgi:hypothetical protein
MKRAHREREWPCFISSPLIMLLWRRIFTIRFWRIGRRLSIALRCRSEKRIKKTILKTLEESIVCAIQRPKHDPEVKCLLFVMQTKAYVTYCTDILQYSAFMLPCCIVIDLFLNNQPDALIIQILFCYRNPHVSVILSSHHQEFLLYIRHW